MTASPDHEPEEQPTAAPAAQEDPARSAEDSGVTSPGQRPLSRAAERFRVPLGVLVALLGAALAVVFAIRPLGIDTGPRGLVTQGAGVALWLCVVAVGVTWALDTSRRMTNLFALGGVACYVLFWLSGR
ncbi:hypothetical protein [Pseudactinotalea suaedae]|uniref:hypothetical protein n=1 Tax=Pseudactinotalea suaedae TaxID=1524924 RepID=UPI0012E22D91|nr:hypothetical protein [Pseudactinotalea suaedae]